VKCTGGESSRRCGIGQRVPWMDEVGCGEVETDGSLAGGGIDQNSL
jgi:hypothetical protein